MVEGIQNLTRWRLPYVWMPADMGQHFFQASNAVGLAHQPGVQVQGKQAATLFAGLFQQKIKASFTWVTQESSECRFWLITN
ncbi:hypothetical protein HORIV_08590 [Vreelandella olivaria]|uniref:Uncharacterized protein n=1 Tax=Vreelandella olivaria TaxID=390919 RepID=A0ABM7GD49_9GAMM|nr:hypothetical protein HORIV_08590 [Halomonas olivaria]